MLKAVVTDLNTVDEGIRGFYTEKDGRFVLNVTATDGYELDNVGGLRTALSAERRNATEANGKLKAFEGIDPNAARTALQTLQGLDGLPDVATIKDRLIKYDDLVKLDPAKKADEIAAQKVEAAVSNLKTQFTARELELVNEKKAADEALTKARTTINTLMLDNTLKSELAKLDVLDDARDVVELLAKQSLRLSEINGQYVVEVLDASGNVRIKDAQMTPLSVGEFLAEMREKRPSLFKPDDKRGLGITRDTGTPGTQQDNPWAKESWNITQQMILTNKNPQLAAQLKSRAGVKD